MKRPLSVVSITILLAGLVSGIAFVKDVKAVPKTIIVPDDFPTIVDAVGNASDGDAIFIKSGTHEGPINQTLVINKSISIIGENVENTIVNLHPKYSVTWIGPVDFYHYSDAMQIDANDFTLANLNLRFHGDMRSSGDRVKIEGNNLWSHSTSARIFINGSGCTIVNNTLLGFINLEGSFNSVARNNAFGLELQSANRSSIYSNILQTLRLDSSDANIIYRNIVSTEVLWYAIEVHNSQSNTFYENFMEVNLWNTNLRIDNNSSNNSFYNNAFMCDYDPNYESLYKNKILVSIDSTANSNSWDNGSVGNYWKDYLLKYPNASEIGSTGIGNTPYVIDENNTDHYPLMNPVNITDIAPPSPSPSPTPSPTLYPTPISTPADLNPTASPTVSPTPESIPEIDFPSWIILPLFLVATFLIAMVYLKKGKH